MRKLLAGITPFFLALMLVMGVNSHAQAGGYNGYIVPTTHEVGTVTAMVAWCLTMPFMDMLIEQALITQNDVRYLEIMTEEDDFKCYDVRYYGRSPLEVAYIQYMKTVEVFRGRLVEIWQVVDTQGAFAYTWTLHHAQGA